MDTKTLKALRGSIKKWQLIAEGVGVDKRDANCPLCAVFSTVENDYTCIGCPIREESGRSGCKNTPYEKWADVAPYDETPPVTKMQKLAALDEYIYLLSLLPDGVYD